MSEVIGEAVVLVRPDTAGFEAAATPGITKAGSSLGQKLGKALLAGFAVAGVYEAVKSVVEAATSQNTAFAVLDQTLKNAGLSIEGFSSSLHDKLEKEARATGVSAENLASAMNRLVPATHSAEESQKDLTTAIGISESYHISLKTAALALAKAETGSFTSLQRYLGLIPKVTTAQDALKARYTNLVASGAKLDTTQKAQYDSALKVAKAQDAQASSQNALALAQQKFAGIPQTFAHSYQGEFDRLHVAVEQLKVAIGTDLVGGLASASAGAADFFGKLLESNKVQRDGAALAHEAGAGLHDLGEVAKTVGPPLLAVADAAAELVKSIGAPAIVTALVTYKAIGIAQGVVAAATTFYNRALLANVGITVEATAANTALAGSNARVAESYTAAGLATALSTEERGVSAFAGGLAALSSGGVGGLAVLGVAALAGGIAYLVTKESAWTSANKAVTGSLQGLTAATQSQQDAVGKLAKQAAATNVAKETQKVIDTISNLAGASTQKSLPPVDFQGVYNDTEFRASQAKRLKALTGDNEQAVQTFVAALGQQSLALGKSDPLLSHNIDLVGQLAEKLHSTHINPIDLKLLINNKDPKASLAEVEAGLDSFAQFLQGVQTLANAATLNVSLNKVFGRVNATVAGAQKFAANAAAAAQKKAALSSAEQALKDSIASDKYDVTSLNQQIADAIRTGAQAVKDAINNAKQSLNSIGQSLATQIGAVIDAPLTVVSKHLQDQTDKLNAQYDKAIAGLNARAQQLTTESDRINLQSSKTSLSQMRDRILLPGGKRLDADPTKAIAQLEALEKRTKSPALTEFIQEYERANLEVEQGVNGLKLQTIGARKAAADAGLQIKGDALKLAQDTADGQKTIVSKHIANLTDLYNRHKISESAFGKGIGEILKKAGVTRAGAIKALGVAGADLLSGDISGLVQQATALRSGPQQAGSGLVPTIVRPLQTLHDQQREINRLRHEEFVKEHDEQKKQTKLLKDIANGKAATKFTKSLENNPGSASKKTQHLTGATR